MEFDKNRLDDNLYRKKLIDYYKADVELLMRYIPWLTQKAGQKTAQIFNGEGIGTHSVTFPVYDSTLMALVKDAQRTTMLDRNYVYVYSRNRLRSAKDELALIADAELKDMENLTGILSHYILGGMTKGTLWTEGVENGVLLAVIDKMREIIKFNDSAWDHSVIG